MRVAIVGSGVAGLVVAHRLAGRYDLTVFEAGEHVGGHVHTHEVDLAGRRFAIDSGFIVFNDRTYPNFCRLIDELGVAWRPSDMSFSVRSERTGFEYNGRSLDTLFAQRGNLLRPSHYAMLRDVLRFHREAPALAGEGEERSLGDWLDERGFCRAFRERYLFPMTAAIWSAPPDQVRRFPLRFLARFFLNHGMLQVDDRPRWRVIEGGSKRYVEALIKPFAARIRLRTPVTRVARRDSAVELTLRDGSRHEFDEVVLACHSDQALRMLADPSREEREILGAIRYQHNDAVLHTDAALMPRRKKVWASWNYHLLDQVGESSEPRAAITYCMNILQGLESSTTFCVTLNHSSAIDPSKVLRRIGYDHPQFTLESARAQARRDEISGARRTWYCGAYWGWGFHEDGVKSALAVVDGFARRRDSVEVPA